MATQEISIVRSSQAALPEVAIKIPEDISRVLDAIRLKREISNIVVFDFNGVLADSTRAFCKSTGGLYTPEEVRKYPFLEHIDPDINRGLRKFLSNPRSTPYLEPYPGSLASVAKITESGLIPVVVTGSPPQIHSAVTEWLDEHGFLDYIDICDVLQMESTIGATREYKQLTNLRVGPFAAIDDQAVIAALLSREKIPAFHITHELHFNYNELRLPSRKDITAPEEAVTEEDLKLIYPVSTLPKAVETIIHARRIVDAVITHEWNEVN